MNLSLREGDNSPEWKLRNRQSSKLCLWKDHTIDKFNQKDYQQRGLRTTNIRPEREDVGLDQQH